MAVKTIDPANDLIQGFDVSDGTPAEGTVYEFVKAAIASGQAINLDYNPSTGRITINSRTASAAEVNAGVANNALLTPGNLGGLSRLSNLAENLRKAIGLQVQRNGASQGTRGALNLIPGTGINIAVSDDTANDRVNATISMASGGSGIWIAGASRLYWNNLIAFPAGNTTLQHPNFGELRGFSSITIQRNLNGKGGSDIIFRATFSTPQPDTNYIIMLFGAPPPSLGGGLQPIHMVWNKSTTQAWAAWEESQFIGGYGYLDVLAFR